MNDAELTSQLDAEVTDRSAILMMLAYVEAECRRLGSEEAARHAALAANLVQGPGVGLAREFNRPGPPARAEPVH